MSTRQAIACLLVMVSVLFACEGLYGQDQVRKKRDRADKAGKNDIIDGVITEVTDTSFTVKIAATGQKKTFAISKRSKITLNGEAGTATDLKVGDKVRVTPFGRKAKIAEVTRGKVAPKPADENAEKKDEDQPAGTLKQESHGDGKGGDFVCTQVIGFSQTIQWYRKGFEKVVDNDKWELRTNSGAGVNRWANPDYQGWKRKVRSPAKKNSNNPDRVVLTISGGYGLDVDKWAEQIAKAIETIKLKCPNVRQIVLQAVVGGPDHKEIPFPGERYQGVVRASAQHPYIDKAIARVVAKDKTGMLVEGCSPEVRSAADFRDAKGHLAGEACEVIGRSIGEFYVEFDK